MFTLSSQLFITSFALKIKPCDIETCGMHVRCCPLSEHACRSTLGHQQPLPPLSTLVGA